MSIDTNILYVFFHIKISITEKVRNHDELFTVL